jgi:hypothetical protein
MVRRSASLKNRVSSYSAGPREHLLRACLDHGDVSLAIQVVPLYCVVPCSQRHGSVWMSSGWEVLRKTSE